MKIEGSVRRLYDDQSEKNLKLKEKMDNWAIVNKHGNWHYDSRIKSLDSFALKLQSGRFSKPEALEDFFACWFVVPTIADLETAERLIEEKFEVKERRPRDKYTTNKEPDNFRFDDLRLYVSFKEDSALPSTIYEDVVFEIQLNTFLMHAWSIATHDLVYKSSTPSWATSRIAFQIRAMLEHAEVSIHEAKTIADSTILHLSTERIERLAEISEFFIEKWPSNELPGDLTHFSENIKFLMQVFEIDLDELKKMLDEETKEGRGTSTINLSPYSVIIQTVYNQKPGASKSGISPKQLRDGSYDKGKKVLVVPEIGIKVLSGIDAVFLPEQTHQANVDQMSH